MMPVRKSSAREFRDSAPLDLETRGVRDYVRLILITQIRFSPLKLAIAFPFIDASNELATETCVLASD